MKIQLLREQDRQLNMARDTVGGPELKSKINGQRSFFNAKLYDQIYGKIKLAESKNQDGMDQRR
jgi:hypothetical protein